MDQVVSFAARWADILQPYALPVYLGAALLLLVVFLILVGISGEVARAAREVKDAREEAYNALHRAEALMLSADMQTDPTRFHVNTNVREASARRPVRKPSRTKTGQRHVGGVR